MKKLLTIVVTALMIVSLAFAANAADISVTLNGEKLAFEQPPVIVEGRTLVPLRAIFEALGASVEWDDATKTVTSKKGDISVKLTIGSNVLYKNNENVSLDVPAQIVGAGYTMVPARAIAESFGVKVDWDDATKTVILTKEPDVAPKDPNALIDVSGENYTGKEGVTTLNNKGLQIVSNPYDSSDKVMFFEANVTGKAAWNYFLHPAKYVPGQKYLIEFKVMPSDSAYGDYVEKPNIGVNVETNGKSKGVGTFFPQPGDWTECALVYQVPADIDLNLSMRFGIFADPVPMEGYDHLVSFSFYLDDVKVTPYTGDLNGIIKK